MSKFKDFWKNQLAKAGNSAQQKWSRMSFQQRSDLLRSIGSDPDDADINNLSDIGGSEQDTLEDVLMSKNEKETKKAEECDCEGENCTCDSK